MSATEQAWGRLWDAGRKLPAIVEALDKTIGTPAAGLSDPVLGLMMALRAQARQITDAAEAYRDARDVAEEPAKVARRRTAKP